MPDRKRKGTAAGARRVRLTVQLTEPAYHAISEIQQRYRIDRGKALPRWKVIDAAVKAYAKAKGIQLER